MRLRKSDEKIVPGISEDYSGDGLNTRPNSLVGFLVMAMLFPAGLASAQQNGQTETKPSPKLSLRSLYHPKHKVDYSGSLPATHWIGKSPSTLLIRRDKTWNQVDLNSGHESGWPVFGQLMGQLKSLPGLKEKQATPAAMNAVAKMRSAEDSVLIKFGKALAIVSPQMPARWLTRDASAWQNTTLDPTATRVAYTRDGDLFVLDARNGRWLQLTNDGTDTILDGILDWTYQEEIFGRGNYRGFWFSSDGQWLAMLRIDISEVPVYTLASAASDRGSGLVRRYPKAGDPIPHASLYVWDLREFDAGHVPHPKLVLQSTPQSERIITGVWWKPRSLELLVSVSDRLQTWRELRTVGASFLNGAQSESTLVLREESPAWVSPPAAPGWLPDGSVVWRSELPTGRSRLYRISPDARIVTPLTPEAFDVREFDVDTDGKFIVVTGDAKHDTIQRHPYRVDLTASDTVPKLIPISQAEGWHATTVSPDGDWLVDRFSTESTPPKLVLRSTHQERSNVLAETSLSLPESIRPPEIFRIRTPDGIELPAMLVRPAGPQPCPVIVEIYGGPQSPVVSQKWSGTKTLYRELLARRGIATLVVDNRSSASRGVADAWAIRGRVGELEFADLMTAVEWLKEQAWVDDKRLAVRGWSFGGFMTLYAMTHTDTFSVGIAGGAVTDWAEYDAFYTERFMGLPSENSEGYRRTAPVLVADKLQGLVMLIHGQADDNVHPSNTLRMAAGLQKAGKSFRLMIYPGSAHAIRNPHQAWHMAQMTDRFLIEELLGNRAPQENSRK